MSDMDVESRRGNNAWYHNPADSDQYLGKTANLLTDPSDTVWHLVERLDDCIQEQIGNLHQHAQARQDDCLNILVCSGRLWRDTARQLWWQGSCIFLNLIDHLLIHFKGIHLQIEILVLNQIVDSFRQHCLQIALTGSSARVRCHHSRNWRISAQKRAEFGGALELCGQDRLQKVEKTMWAS